MPLGKLRLGIALFVLSFVVGTAGYMWIEGWTFLEAFWMVSITLTTIGFGEVRPLSDAGRWFTIALIMGGLSAASYTVGQLTRYVIEGDLQRDVRRRRRERIMRSISDHFIVAGFGRLGAEVAAELRHAGRPVVVLDTDPARIGQADEDGFTALVGDASQDDMLRLAGIERARGLAVATSSTAVNVFVTLSARQLNPSLRIITRVEDEEAVSKAHRAGATSVVSPHGIGGAHMAHGLLRPEARSFLDLATHRSYRELGLEDVRIGAGGAADSLGAMRLRERFHVMVIAIRRTDGALETVPGPDTRLAEGDVAVVIGKPDDVARFAEAAQRGLR